MDSSDRLRKTITRTYVTAFSVIALLMTVFFAYSQFNSASNAILPAVINKAGMQRMLSQRIALITHMLVNQQPPGQHDALRNELRERIAMFLENHAILTGAVVYQGEVLTLSPELKQHYYDGLTSLDNMVKQYAARATRISELPLAELSEAQLPSAAQTLRLLDRLDRAVFLYESMLNERLNRERWAEALVWLTMLLAMLGSVFFLFRPLENIVIKQFMAREDAQRAAERERANADMAHQVKADFLSKMSHEFRTPISAMIGALELIPNMRSKQHELIQQAEQACYRLLTMTNNLLDIIGVTSQMSSSEEMQFDLVKLMEECIAPVSALCRAKQLEFSMRCHSSLPHYVKGHPLEMNKAIKNVLDNAVKFTEKGFIGVGLEVEVLPGEFLLTISVTDTGIGIEESHHERIFERFYQCEVSPNRQYTGAGIGLTVALQQLQSIGGNITLSSQVGVGSEFTITVPLKPCKEKAIPVEAKTNATFAIVDDLEISRQYLSNLITSEGFKAECFKSGSELLARHEQMLGYTAIIADFYMPGISGVELARTVSAIFGEKTPPLIMMSATPEIANIIANSQISAWQVFLKPVDRARFIDTLKQLASPRYERNSIPSGRRILVVEDEPINAEIMNDMLHNLGYQPMVAKTGEEALVSLRSHTFDLMLLDINLPDMNGLDVAKVARESGLELPIVAATANAYESDKDASRQAGIRYHLVKPISYQELKNTLKLALSLHA
ncbi:response regulator [Alteromonas sp. H39]|uniref:response regulator n=1 Tax=Alteromonas sp. H39 TaxID=3389876 RepID=UPI0039E07AA1